MTSREIQDEAEKYIGEHWLVKV